VSPAPSRGRRLSALVVNYNTGRYAKACVESLQCEWRASGRADADLEIVVVDNASPQDQSAALAEIEALGARVIRHPENAGYATGMNLAFAQTSGGPRDMVAILNPDLHFLPGSIDALMDYLETYAECGVIDPRAWVDQARTLMLPKNVLPTPIEQWRAVGAQLHPALCRAYSRRRLVTAIPWWVSDQPIESDMLSGCCLFLRREVVARMPHLMDPLYPLYFEDTDLFSTLRRLGYTVVHHCGAPVLHHWSRSAGVGGNYQGEPWRRFKIGEQRYYRKFHGALGYALVRAANWLAAKWPPAKSFRPMHPLVDLGEHADPIEIRLPRACEYLLEFSMTPTWLLAAGVPGHGERWQCPRETWEWYFQARYYVRAIEFDRRTQRPGALLGAWTFVKTTPGRDHPLEVNETRRSATMEAAR